MATKALEKKASSNEEDNKTVKQAGKFGLVGLLNTGIDVGVYFLLTAVFGLTGSFTFLVFTIFFARLISTSMAMTNSFIWNKYWTFKNKDQAHIAEQGGQFILFTLIGLGINNIVFGFFKAKFTLPGEFFHSIAEFIGLGGIFSKDLVVTLFAMAMGIGLTMTWNFLAYKKIVFKK